MSKITEFKPHKVVDRSDPGFTIPGRTLRWVSGKVSELSPGRPWAVIRKADLPPDLLKHLLGVNPDAFANGDTIRRGDLVLAYTTVERAEALRKEKRQAAMDQELVVKRAVSARNRAGKEVVKVDVDETADATTEMLEKFKKNREEGE